MKFVVLSENLLKKLLIVNKGISSKGTLPVLSNMLIEAKDGKLVISSTDLEIGFLTEIPANIEEEGAVTVPAKQFYELIVNISSEKVTIQTKENTLEAITEKTKTKFPTIPKEEFPKLYEEKGEEILSFNKEEVQKAFQKVIFAASLDTARPALSGVLIKVKKNKEKKVSIVATDGYRLSVKENVFEEKEKKEEGPEQEEQILIPVRVVKEAVNLKEEEQDLKIYISKKNNQVVFQKGTTLLVGRLIEADFPTYEKIIPKDFLTQVVFEKEEMQKAVKICSIFAREAANIIKMSIQKGKIVVSASAPSLGENTVDVEAKLAGEENEISFNAKYLIDLLSNIEDGQIVFEMTSPLSPGVFKIAEDPTFLHLIMPIRIQEQG